MVRRIGKVLAIVAACVAAIALSLGAWIAAHLDDPPSDDRDLRVSFPPLAESENGAPQLDAIAKRVAWPDDDATAERLDALVTGAAWDDALAERWLGENAFLLPALDAALERRVRFVPERPYATESPVGQSWCRPARVAALQAVSAAHRGDPEAALGGVMRILRIARALEGADHVSPLQLSYAGCIRRHARRALGGVLAASQLTSRASLRWAAEIGAWAPDAASWRAAWAERYRFRSALSHAEPPPGFRVESAWWVPDRYLFKPNATDARLADFYRMLQRWADRPCSAAPTGALLQRPSPGESLRALVAPNGVGNAVLIPMVVASDIEVSGHRCRIASDHSALVALAGLAAYRSEHGELPPTLGALVPAYLPALPRDGFDGSALRYDPSRRLLWTIAGGDPPERAPRREGLDFAFAIPF